MSKPTFSIADLDTLLIDWIDGDGHIASINDVEARVLGIAMAGSLPLERVYSSTSAQLLRAIARGEQMAEASFPVWVNSPRYSEIPMVASTVRDAARGLAVVKQALSQRLALARNWSSASRSFPR